MRISGLIAQLEAAKATHGDVEVITYEYVGSGYVECVVLRLAYDALGGRVEIVTQFKD